MLGKRKERSTLSSAMEASKEGDEKAGTSLAKKAEECTTSRYRGVTKHRRSGRWESHIWAAAKGKQIYLGGYELEEHAASAYDVARLKIKGKAAKTNFDISNYTELLEYLEKVSLDELVTAVRRQSQGFAKCPTGVKWITKHPSGKWEAKALVGSCTKFINLGLFDSEYAAVTAYHKAMTKMSGKNNNTITSAMQSANVHYEQKYRDSPKALEALQNAVHPSLLVKPVPVTTVGGGNAEAMGLQKIDMQKKDMDTAADSENGKREVNLRPIFPKMEIPNSVANTAAATGSANVSLSSTLASMIQIPSDFKFLSTSGKPNPKTVPAVANILQQTSGSMASAANQQHQLQLLASLTSQSQKELALHFQQKLLKGDK